MLSSDCVIFCKNSDGKLASTHGFLRVNAPGRSIAVKFTTPALKADIVEHRTFLSKRNIGLDFLRAILILEGVLYHAARSLPGSNNWYYVADKNQADIFSAIIEFIHTFRMEAFFFLSGMFSAMVFARKGAQFFLNNRCKRVLLPLVASFAFIPGVMYVITAAIKGEALSLEGLLHGYTYLHHLWFLVSLSAMSFLIPGRWYNRLAQGMRRLPFPALVIALIVACNVFFVVKFLVKDSGEFISLIPVTARFAVYYAAGYALYLNSDKIPQISQSWLLNNLLVAALGLISLLAFYVVLHQHITSSLKYVPVLISSVFSVVFSYWLVFTFEKLRMKENALVKGIVDSALVIYIMHYPLVITGAWLLDDYIPDNLSVTYVFINTLVALCLSTLLYLVIKQFSPLSVLFGLKPAAKAAPSLANQKG